MPREIIHKEHSTQGLKSWIPILALPLPDHVHVTGYPAPAEGEGASLLAYPGKTGGRALSVSRDHVASRDLPGLSSGPGLGVAIHSLVLGHPGGSSGGLGLTSRAQSPFARGLMHCSDRQTDSPEPGGGGSSQTLGQQETNTYTRQPRPGRGEWPDPEETWNPEQDAARRHLFLPHLSICF